MKPVAPIEPQVWMERVELTGLVPHTWNLGGWWGCTMAEEGVIVDRRNGIAVEQDVNGLAAAEKSNRFK